MKARFTGAVLAAWILLIALENLVVGIGWRHLFVAPWEMGIARTLVSPIALALLAPLAPVVVAVAPLARSPRGEKILAVLALLACALVAYGVTNGRHFRSLPLRVAFVLVLAALAWLAARAVVPRLVRSPRPLVASLGVAAAAAAWSMDAFLLPRLYPAFHAALAAGIVLAFAGLSLVIVEGRQGPWIARGAFAVTAISMLWAWFAGQRLAAYDNLRLVLLDHAPLLGRAVLAASRWAPPPALDAEPSDPGTRREAARALDWSGHDIILLSVDALRADHVSSYGYARRTTPRIDQLAAAGARFTHAYCATPHTSYSVTSMMTGKHMRPLLSLGLGEDSETWAAYLRRYGYRTGAFYPPAVFFIDEDRFVGFRDRGLDFEYRKVEFASPALEVEHVERFLAKTPADHPLYAWVHLFDPHEPYEVHPELSFGDPTRVRDVDAYDSEVAQADDTIGKIVDVARRLRPGAVLIVTADHGEEFGDHGGRYHGTTVYEEQVRVPLVVVGPGVAPRVVTEPVQTIDLVPTVLSALDIPRPARVMGQDLGGLLVGRKEARVAFAETDAYTMTAEGTLRLVCERRAQACALYDVATDPLETRDLSSERASRTIELRKRTRTLELEQGRYERPKDALPEALRRGLQGETDAALDVATLLDDASVSIRRLAAEVGFRLHQPEARAQTARTLARDEDLVVRRWCALALVRMGDPPPALVEDLLADPEWRARAALVLAERGDARGAVILVDAWPASQRDFETAKDVLRALGKIRARSASKVLTRSLADVRLRPYVVDALVEIGAEDARPQILAVFERERYQTLRSKEARALAALGARAEILPGLQRFAGVPDPMVDALPIAMDLGLLDPQRGGARQPKAASLDAAVRVPAGVPLRMLARAEEISSAGVDGRPVLVSDLGGGVFAGDVPPRGAESTRVTAAGKGITGVWLVPIVPELPPPAPEKWDAGPGGDD